MLSPAHSSQYGCGPNSGYKCNSMRYLSHSGWELYTQFYASRSSWKFVSETAVSTDDTVYSTCFDSIHRSVYNMLQEVYITRCFAQCSTAYTRKRTQCMLHARQCTRGHFRLLHCLREVVVTGTALHTFIYGRRPRHHGGLSCLITNLLWTHCQFTEPLGTRTCSRFDT